MPVFARLIFIAAIGLSSAANAVECALDKALFLGEGNFLSFDVEIADTPSERAQGLMYRRELDELSGMLFIYEDARPVSFWMKNTYIPLDLVFIDDRGLVRHIHREAIPFDETPLPGHEPGSTDPDRLMVLEIAGGEAARLGLKQGQFLVHPALDQARAIFPCAALEKTQ